MLNPFNRHWYMMGGVPVAVVQKVAVVPTGRLVLTGPAPRTGGVRTRDACENSEVFLSGSVAVAVINWVKSAANAKGTENEPVPVLAVVTEVEPRNVWPWPYPDGSALLLRKNSIL